MDLWYEMVVSGNSFWHRSIVTWRKWGSVKFSAYWLFGL